MYNPFSLHTEECYSNNEERDTAGHIAGVLYAHTWDHTVPCTFEADSFSQFTRFSCRPLSFCLPTEGGGGGGGGGGCAPGPP